MEELKNIYMAIDEAFAKVRENFPEEVRCGQGCDDCCHAVFDVSLVEALGVLAMFKGLPEETRSQITGNAVEAMNAWEALVDNSNLDIATARISCPLLSDSGQCQCYEVRPVNCRSYGVPTVIDKAGHVCGLSGFKKGVDYPTIDLQQVQNALLEMSVKLAGDEDGRRRWPLAAVFLDPGEVIALLKSR
jgi:Fe-S-cluster containining protein